MPSLEVFNKDTWKIANRVSHGLPYLGQVLGILIKTVSPLDPKKVSFQELLSYNDKDVIMAEIGQRLGFIEEMMKTDYGVESLTLASVYVSEDETEIDADIQLVTDDGESDRFTVRF